MSGRRRFRQPVSIHTFEQAFPDEATCKAYMFFHSAGLAHRCGHGKSMPAWRPMAGRSSFHCRECWTIKQVRARTVFRSTNIPVRTIFYAMLLMLELPGNPSIGFLRRQLGISRKFAQALANRIRIHMAALEEPRVIGGPDSTVWIDETLIRLSGERSLTCILGITDSRNLSLKMIPDRSASTLLPLIEETVVHGSVLVTDSLASYRLLSNLGWKHTLVRHSNRIWTDREGRSSAPIELVWRWLKRQVAGSTGQIGQDDFWKHLKQFLYKYHARPDPADAFWRLISTYPPADRYRVDALRQEVDSR